MNSALTRKLSSATSPRMMSVTMENFRSGKQLETELDSIEKQRRSKMRELNFESKHFVDYKLRASSSKSRSRSPSPSCCIFPPLSPGREGYGSNLTSPSMSPRSVSPSPPKSRSQSPRPARSLMKSLSTEECPRPSRSPSSSPEAQRRLLTKRGPSPTPMSRATTITESTVITPLALNNVAIKHPSTYATNTHVPSIRHHNGTMELSSSNSTIPQIVINDTSAEATKSNVKKHTITANISAQSTGNKNVPKKKHDAPERTLKTPIRPFRRHSLPPTPPHSNIQFFSDNDTSTSGTNNNDGKRDSSIDRYRGRSGSVCVPYFSHLKNAPRRDSLLRKYIVKPGLYRRSAGTLERLISDLARGVHHTELLDRDYSSSRISDEEWEKLKLCRYLRMPSKDEDVTGNTIDVEDIFSADS